MSKIVCDVCGTSYPDTTNQCPICGNIRSEAASVESSPAVQEADAYGYVKGGRFSHANVKKRNSGKTELPRTGAPAKPVRESQPVQQEPVAEEQQPVREARPVAVPQRRERKPQRRDDRASNIGLLIIVILLVIAILGVCGYITIRLLDMNSDPTLPPKTTTTAQKDPTGTTGGATQPTRIPCNSVSIQMPSYTFSAVGQTLLLNVTKDPIDSTDVATFESSDSYIATVDANGKIVAVADGNVTITIRCGDQVAVCEITCQVGVAPAYPTVPTTSTTKPLPPTTSSTVPAPKLQLNSADFTLNGYGSTHNLYSGDLDPAAITWSTSDAQVAVVTNGIVKAVGNGTATITAQYEDETVTCIVRCKEVMKVSFRLSVTDTTIAVGQTFTLKAYLVDEEGNDILDENGKKIAIDPSELKFYVTDAEEYVSVEDNGKVTGKAYNLDRKTKYKYVYVEYNGVVLKCIVRVKNAST